MASMLWERADAPYCKCMDLPYAHTHCPCELCCGRAVSRSKEYRHWVNASNQLRGVVIDHDNADASTMQLMTDIDIDGTVISDDMDVDITKWLTLGFESDGESALACVGTGSTSTTVTSLLFPQYDECGEIAIESNTDDQSENSDTSSLVSPE